MPVTLFLRTVPAVRDGSCPCDAMMKRTVRSAWRSARSPSLLRSSTGKTTATHGPGVSRKCRVRDGLAPKRCSDLRSSRAPLAVRPARCDPSNAWSLRRDLSVELHLGSCALPPARSAHVDLVSRVLPPADPAWQRHTPALRCELMLAAVRHLPEAPCRCPSDPSDAPRRSQSRCVGDRSA